MAASASGLNGFVNLGNTCYFNSTLQMLMNIEPFRKYFIDGAYKADMVAKMEQPIAEIFGQWLKIITTYWTTRGGTINPVNFIRALAAKRPQYLVASQKDSAECLADIFDLLHQALRYSIRINIQGRPVGQVDMQMIDSLKAWKDSVGKDYSIITELFYGQYQSRMTCGSCRREEIRYDTFFATPLATRTKQGRGIQTLHEALDLFCLPESISNEWTCDACAAVSTLHKQLVFWKMPEILILTFQRFDNANNKIGHMIDYPVRDLDLRRWTKGYDADNCTYDLCDIIVHNGGTGSGHYLNVHHGNGADWHLIDDDAVRGIKDTQIKTAGAYILVYRKKTI